MPTGGAVLVLRALGLGDLLVAVPALRALRRWTDAALPGAQLVLATPRVLAPLLGPLVDRVIDLDAKDAAALAALPPRWTADRTVPPDVAVNLHGRGPASHRALAALHPGRLVGFGCPEAGVTGPVWDGDPLEHETARWCRLVAQALGTRADPADLLLEPPATVLPMRGGETVPLGAVVVHPGAASGSRRWPPDRWARVARALADDGHRVVVTGSPDEVTLAEAVQQDAGLPATAVLAGRTDLAGLAAVVARAPLVVCGDTGVAHLASAYATSSVVLLGPTSPARWGPPAGGPHTVLWHGAGVRAGDPHGTEPDPVLLRVGVGEVLAAARARLRSSGTAGPAAVRTPGGRTTPASA